MKRIYAAALVALFTSSALSVGIASGATRASASECIETNPAGRLIWHASAEGGPAIALSDALQALANANHDQVSGVSMCSDYLGAAIYVSDPSPNLITQIEAAGAKFPDAALHIEHVAAGLTDQLAAQARVTSIPNSVSTLADVGPDMYTGGLDVSVQSAAWPMSDDLQREIIAAATASGTVDMPIQFKNGTVGKAFTTRLADTQPYYGGDEIIGRNEGCSAGFPIVVNGVHGMLTAGHCTASSFTNNGHAFGTQYTTAYPGNADIYGDWKLLSGQTYALRIFSGAVSSSATLQVTSANWQARQNGLQMCTSGSVTGSICRYFITKSYDEQPISGVWTNNLLAMQHDSTGSGLYADWDGAGPGDSGGPCYYSNGAGGVIAAGIVTGGDASTLTYWCTQLSGVRAWKSGANIG